MYLYKEWLNSQTTWSIYQTVLIMKTKHVYNECFLTINNMELREFMDCIHKPTIHNQCQELNI